MQSSVGIRERIDHVYPSLRPAERAVAQYIRNHIEEAADLTVGQMADIAHVSQPTVIRSPASSASAVTVNCGTCCATRPPNTK